MTTVALLAELWRRLRMLLAGSRFDRELREEMELHRDLRARELRREGHEAVAATQIAADRFGNVLRLREAARAEWGWEPVDHLARDFGAAIRGLRQSAGPSLLAALALGGAVACAAAAICLLDSTRVTSLAFPHGDRLVIVGERLSDGLDVSVAYPDYLAWKSRQQAFDGFALYRRFESRAASRHALAAQGAAASSELFDTMGWRALRGRVLEPQDDAPGAAPTVVLSAALWRSDFGGATDIVGKSVTLGGRPFSVVGVLADAPAFPLRAAFWTAVGAELDEGTVRNREKHARWNVLARLRPGRALPEARRELDAILQAAFSPAEEAVSSTATPLRAAVFGGYTRELRYSLLAAALFLVLANANVAMAQSTRGAFREAEIRLRKTLGAEPSRIFRQLMMESVVLAFAGCAVGAGLFGPVLGVARRSLPPSGLVAESRSLVAWTSVSALAVVLSAAFSAWSCWRVARTPVEPSPRYGLPDPQRSQPIARCLVAAQIGAAAVLVTVGGVTAAKVSTVRAQELGFDPEGVALVRVHPAGEKHTMDYDGLIGALRRANGVAAASLTTAPPLDANLQMPVSALDTAQARAYVRPLAQVAYVEKQYFDALRIPIAAGRAPRTPSANGTPEAAIDESLARSLWSSPPYLGRQISVGGREFLLVGIVATVRLGGYGSTPSRGQIYLAYEPNIPITPTLVVRSGRGTDPARVALAVASARELGGARIYSARRLVDDLRMDQGAETLTAVWWSIVALAAVLVATAGLHGYATLVLQRTERSSAIRRALGAAAAREVRTVSAPAVQAGLAGLGAGLVLGVGIAAAWLGSAGALRSLATLPGSIGPVTLVLLTTLAAFAPAVSSSSRPSAVVLRRE